GPVAGILLGGWLGDTMLRRGSVNSRIAVAAWGYLIAGTMLFPAFLMHDLLPAVPFFIVGGAAMIAPNPSLDAARLDIVHPQLWGRAESYRTLLAALAEAGGPALFGWLSVHLAGGGAAGLRLTILIAVPALVVNGVILLLALRTYPREVASVLESNPG